MCVCVFVSDMMNIAVLLIIVLVILSVAAVNILGWKIPDIYGNFGLGIRTSSQCLSQLSRSSLSFCRHTTHLFRSDTSLVTLPTVVAKR